MNKLSLGMLWLVLLLCATGMQSPTPIPKGDTDRQTKLTIQSSTSIYPTEDTLIVATLVDGTGRPVSDGEVRIVWDGERVLRGLTDKRGVVAFPLPAELSVGEHRLVLEYHGKQGLHSSKTQAIITVLPSAQPDAPLPTAPLLLLHPLSPIEAEKAFTITLEVRATSGFPLAGAEVNLLAGSTWLGRVTTDEQGLASVGLLNGLPPDTYQLQASLVKPSTAGNVELGDITANAELLILPKSASISRVEYTSTSSPTPSLTPWPTASPTPSLTATATPFLTALPSFTPSPTPSSTSVPVALVVNGQESQIGGFSPPNKQLLTATSVTGSSNISPEPTRPQNLSESTTATSWALITPTPRPVALLSENPLLYDILLVVALLTILSIVGIGVLVSRRTKQQPKTTLYTLQPRRSQSQPPPRPRGRLYNILCDYLFHVRWRLLLAALSMIGGTAASLLSPWPLKIIFDYVLLDRELPDYLGSFAPLLESDITLFVGLAVGAIAVIALLDSGFSYLQTLLTARIGYELVNKLRGQLFIHLQQLPLSFYHRTQRGEILTKVASDTAIFKEVLTESGLALLTNILTFIGMFTVMFIVNWQLTLIPLATFPILFVVFGRMQVKVKESIRRQRKQTGKLNSRLNENLSIISLVQAFGREEHEVARFEDQNTQDTTEGVRVALMSAAMTRTISIISSAGLAAVIFFGAVLALRGAMTPGDVLIFVTYVKSLYKPIRTVVKLSTKVSRAWVSAQRISEIIDIEPEIQDKPNAIVASHLRGAITFEYVNFGYDAQQPILSDLSFSVEPGERVALVGPSGAGKSTIANLLLRLYDCQSGRITLDGIDLRDYQRTSVRRQIGLVLQDSILFGATIRENIAYGKPDATLSEIEAAAHQAHIHDFIQTLPDRYDTVLGEMGSTISGGQRQRIAIARALVKKPSILLLDEPTSALDAESTAQVEETIRQLRGNKTILVIAHQLDSIQDFDQILVLNHGHLVERGTHEALLATDGLYAELYHLQEGGRAKESIADTKVLYSTLAERLN